MAFRGGGGGGGWALRLAQAWALIATTALILVLLRQHGSSNVFDGSNGAPAEVSLLPQAADPTAPQLVKACKQATRQTVFDGG